MYQPSNIPKYDSKEAEVYDEKALEIRLNVDTLRNRNETVTNEVHKISKDKLNQVKPILTPSGGADVEEKKEVKNDTNYIIGLFEPVNPNYEKLYPMKGQRKAVDEMLKKFGREELATMVQALPKVNKIKGMTVTTTPYQLQMNMGRIKGRLEQEKTSGKGKKINV